MDKKNYTLSEVIYFVTNGENSSNVDSDEEKEIVILSPIQKAETETDCDSDISDDENEGPANHMPRRLLTASCSTNTVKQNLDETNQTCDDESYEQPPKRHKQNKKEEGNRLQVAPLKNETALQKKTRGTFDYTSDGNNLRVAWRDGKVIIVVTNDRMTKKADIDSAHDIVDPNELPAELSDSIKTPFDAFWNIYSDDLLDIIAT